MREEKKGEGGKDGEKRWMREEKGEREERMGKRDG